jgi:hypothetical protein
MPRHRELTERVPLPSQGRLGGDRGSSPYPSGVAGIISMLPACVASWNAPTVGSGAKSAAAMPHKYKTDRHHHPEDVVWGADLAGIRSGSASLRDPVSLGVIASDAASALDSIVRQTACPLIKRGSLPESSRIQIACGTSPSDVEFISVAHRGPRPSSVL